MSRDEIEALVARAMATRCHGTCDDTEHRMLDALCAEVELLRMERDALLSAAREGNATALRAIAGRDEARDEAERAERAEAQLAALREAAADYVAIDDAEAAEYGTADIPARPGSPRWRIDRALSDAKTAAEAHDRRVRAEALREAAGTCSSRASEHEADIVLALDAEGWVTADRLRFRSVEALEIASKLRANADEIEAGQH